MHKDGRSTNNAESDGTDYPQEPYHLAAISTEVTIAALATIRVAGGDVTDERVLEMREQIARGELDVADAVKIVKAKYSV
ncbi:MAG: hypothetical protein GX483_00665 [Actinomycetaceae bacterium]|nr:hypothetical protein [Actinomycetaceae bacterium]